MLRRFSINFAILSMVIDGVVVIAMLWLMTYLRPTLDDLLGTVFLIKEIDKPISLPLILYFIFPVTWVLIMLSFSVYNGRRNLRAVDEITRLTLSAILAGISLAGLLYLSYRDVSRFLFITFVVSTYLILLLWRFPARILYQWRNLRSGRIHRALLVGAGAVGREVAAGIEKHSSRVQIVGFLDDDPAKSKNRDDILGTLDEARRIAAQYQVDDVLITLPLRAHERLNQLIWALFDLPLRVWIVPDYFQWTLHHAEIENFNGIPLLDVRAPALNEEQHMVKRLFDLLLTVPATILLLPLMGIIALAIWLDDGFPFLFSQQRVGENGRLFTVYKFRTMVKDAEKLRHTVEEFDENGNILHKHSADPRVTCVGRFLRRWSLDELPQLFNVLNGTMSLVGPRPELPYLVEKYQPWQRKRFAVPQGITGWWQVNGRSDKPMHLHTEDDLYYIQNYSIWLDIQIIIKTFLIVLRGKGAY